MEVTLCTLKGIYTVNSVAYNFPSDFDRISGKSWLRSLFSLGASSLYPKKKKQPQKRKKKSRWFMRKKNTGTGLSLSNFSQQHSWIFYVRGVREISGRAANSENDMIFWEVVERSTASPEKVTLWVLVAP